MAVDSTLGWQHDGFFSAIVKARSIRIVSTVEEELAKRDGVSDQSSNGRRCNPCNPTVGLGSPVLPCVGR